MTRTKIDRLFWWVKLVTVAPLPFDEKEGTGHRIVEKSAEQGRPAGRHQQRPQRVLCLLTFLLYFLQMTLRDEMLDIRSAYHEPLALLKVELRLNDPPISNHHTRVLGWLRYADGDIEFMTKL
jgi:hypothetical protein